MSMGLAITVLIFYICNENQNISYILWVSYYPMNKASPQFKSTDTEHIFADQGEFSEIIQIKLKIEMDYYR